MSFPRTSCLLLATLLGLGAPAGAQDRSESIPRELALALLTTGFDGEDSDLLVGRAPGDFPADALPPGGEVLGSLVHPRRSTVVVRMPRPTEASLAAVEARLLGAGWRQASMGRPRGGFVDVRGPRPFRFCRGQEVLHVFAVPREQGSLLRLQRSGEGSSPECGSEVVVHRPALLEPPVPSLYPPGGARSHGSTGGGSQDHWESSTRLETDLDPAALLEHYSAQLQRAGWTPDAPVAGPAVATRVLRFRGPQGEAWHGVLLATSLPGTGEREVLIRAMREAADRAHAGLAHTPSSG